MSDHMDKFLQVASILRSSALKYGVRLRGEGSDSTISNTDNGEFETYVMLPKYRVGVSVDRTEIADNDTTICVAIVEAALARSAARLRGRVIRLVSEQPVDWDHDACLEGDERLATWLIDQGEQILRRLKGAAA